MDRLAMDPAACLVPLDDGRLQIRTPTERLTVGRQASLAQALLRLCDGTRSLDEILALLPPQGHDEREARALCTLLLDKGVLTPAAAGEPVDPLLAAVRHHARRAPGGHGRAPAVRQGAVAVTGRGRLAEALRATFEHLGWPLGETASAGAPAALTLVCSDTESHAAFLELNRELLSAGKPALYACIAERGPRIGPLVVPGETACFECYHHRLRSNVAFRAEFDAFVSRGDGSARAAHGRGPVLYGRLAAVLVCAQALNYLLGATQHCLFERIVEIDPVTAVMTTDRFLRLPRCEVCAGVSQAPPPAVRDWL